MFKKKLTENFALNEFINTTDALAFQEHRMQPLLVRRLTRVAEALEVIRAESDGTIIITSGWRSPSRNALVGGSKTSDHPTGWCADFKSAYINADRLFVMCQKLQNAGLINYDQLIGYAKHVHISVNPRFRGQSWKT